MPDGQMTLPKAAYERQEFEYYPTPKWITQLICEHVPLRGLIWEPAAGDGAMVKVLQEYGHKVVASDIQGDQLGFAECQEANFLSSKLPYSVGTIVTNPPYLLARDFILHALQLTKSVGGMVVMVLRNEFDCAIKRRHLFAQQAFREKIVLTRRPIWFPDREIANHPRHNFGLFCWDHQYTGAATIRWLPEAKDKRGVVHRNPTATPEAELL